MVSSAYLVLVSIIAISLTLVAFNIFTRAHSNARKRDIAKMNRKVVEYSDVKGWLVLIDKASRTVGLYNDQFAISHAKIHIGKELMNQVGDNPVTLTIEDFRTIDVDIPRFSYRVLYEYNVPHSTPVIIY